MTKFKKMATGMLSFVIVASGCANGTTKSETTAAQTETTSTQSTTTIITTVESTEQNKKEIWEIRYYIDEFNRPTEEKYITGINSFEGLFSNSATSNSKLSAVILFDGSGCSIMLYKYGLNIIKNPSSDSMVEYNVSVLDTEDNRIELNGGMFAGGDRIFLDHTGTLINTFSKDGQVSFYIEEKDKPINNYKFTIETGNFSEMYNILCRK